MLESYFKVSPLKITLSLLLLVFAVHAFAQSEETEFLITDPNSGATQVRPTGLELGNDLTHVSLKGHVRMQCEDYLLATVSEYDCTMDTLEPFTSSRFQTSTSVDADHFDLNVQHEKTWSRSKSGEYVPSSGTSMVSLNLWNSSIFDLPILSDGVNRATYRLTKNGKAVATGAFIVNVSKVSRTCAPARLVSYDPGDCRKKAYACDRYFFQNRHCLTQ